MAFAFLIAALVLAILAALNPLMPPFPRPHLGWAAFACYMVSLVLSRGAG